MRKPTPITNSFMSLSLTILFILMATGRTFAAPVVSLEEPVHFTDAEGGDVVLDAQSYTVEAAEDWLRVTPLDGQAVDALILEAQVATHEETLTEPNALSAKGETADTYHLALLLPDGKRLEAVGTYSGIRSRGTLSLLTIQRLRTLSGSTQSTASTEFITPRLGGNGGNRSYDLDCGNGAVIVGATYRSGSWLDALGLICQRVNAQTGALEDDFTRGPVGGAGGDPRILRCPSGRVVGAAQGYYKTYVHAITLSCYRWDASRKAPIFVDKTALFREGRENFIRAGAKDIGYTCPWCPIYRGFQCPSGKAGKALRGKHGIYIDNFRFVCDFWDK